MFVCFLTVGDTHRSDSGSCSSEPQQDSDVFSPTSPLHSFGSPIIPSQPGAPHGRSISISVVPCSDNRRPEEVTDAFTPEPSKMRMAKSSHTPPPPSRKLLQLFPNIVLTRSKSQESQLANRIEEPATLRW